MPNCSADKGLEAIPIRGVSETPPGWSSICNLGHCSRKHSVQSRRRHAMATKGSQFIRNTCTASNNIIDVCSYSKVVDVVWWLWCRSSLVAAAAAAVDPLFPRLTAILQDNPGKPYLFPFWILLELRKTEAVITTGAIRRRKLQSNRHHQQTNTLTNFSTNRMPFLSPNQQCQSTRQEARKVVANGFSL